MLRYMISSFSFIYFFLGSFCLFQLCILVPFKSCFGFFFFCCVTQYIIDADTMQNEKYTISLFFFYFFPKMCLDKIKEETTIFKSKNNVWRPTENVLWNHFFFLSSFIYLNQTAINYSLSLTLLNISEIMILIIIHSK